MDNFTYRYPVRQHFGKGCAESAIKEEMARVGRNVLLAYGGGSLKRTGLYDKVVDWLHECGKNVSAQAKSDEDIWEMQYTKHRYPTEFVPMGAVVTASGTGAEQNNGAVITNTEKKLKQPLVGSYHSFAILDSDLTRTVPMKQVISGAFDTLSHCMETYMGRPQEDNVSDGINEAVMRNVIRNLRALIADPDDDFARGELMWDSALAVIHPALYRHLLAEGKEKLARMGERVWGVKGRTTEETAAMCIDALEAFIRESCAVPRLSCWQARLWHRPNVHLPRWISPLSRVPTPILSDWSTEAHSLKTKRVR